MPISANRPLEVTTDNGFTVRVTAVTPSIFRVQISPDGQFGESGLVRYGVVKTDWPEVSIDVAESGGVVSAATGEASLEIVCADGRVILRDSVGKALTQSAASPAQGGHKRVGQGGCTGPSVPGCRAQLEALRHVVAN